MTNPRPTNQAASVRQRLKNAADATSRPFAEVLQWYAIERFLARFSRTVHRESYLLKGAALLRVWEVTPARPTMDIDFGTRGIISVDEAETVVTDCLDIEVEPDGLEFDRDSVKGEPIRIALEYPGVRVRWRGTLGTARVTLQVDIGFGDSVVPAPEEIEYPTLLGHPEPRLIGYRPETVVAEKLHAIVDLGVRTSRMKDYFDLWWLIGNRTFDGSTMNQALVSTFSRRQTQITNELPDGLSDQVTESDDKSRQWAGFVRRMRFSENPVSFENAVLRVREFAMPLFQTVASGALFTSTWTPVSGWDQKLE